MIVWRKEYIRHTGTASEVVFKRHECEWLLPQDVAKHLPFNRRQLPVVQRRQENEDHYLRLSIRRIINGYRTHRTAIPMVQWYKDQS